MTDNTARRKAPWTDGSAKCVVMCGGRSTRFLSTGEHKTMAPIRGRPLINHVVTFWRAFTDDFVFVVKHGRDPLMEYLRTLPIRAEFVEPAELKGIADGLRYVEPLISGPFIVVLGDCFCVGELARPERFETGIGVQATDNGADIRRNYSVEIGAGDRVVRVVEKPTDVSTGLCGLGYYFFQPSVFDAIGRTAPSTRTGHAEITDVVQTIIDSQTPVRPLMLKGHYVNVTVPDDIQRVEGLVT